MLYTRNKPALLLGLLFLLWRAPTGRAEDAIPCWLPHYDLNIHLDVDQHQAHVRERVTWTNRHACQVKELIFNVHSNYKIPDKDVGFLAKMLEILRMAPSECLDFEGHACQVEKVSFVALTSPAGEELLPPPSPYPLPHHGGEGRVRGQVRGAAPESEGLQTAPLPQLADPSAHGLPQPVDLPFHYDEKNQTALVIPLPQPVGPNQSVTVELEFLMRLPPKQGRWGQWKNVTFLAQWLPVVAYHDAGGWQPAPFIPWHQPYFNEAGIYRASVTLPACQKVGCTASIHCTKDLGNGLVQVDFEPRAARDFALFCSPRYQEFTGMAGPVRVRCLAFPEHAFYAREMVRIACEAIPVYSKWFGPFPYPEFTIVESYFGWNGNECGGLVMIDERIFCMPHLAMGFVDYLVSHETCHQWWYNVVGTNGYAETWMDEGLATYFGHRLMTQKYGKNNEMLHYPKGMGWLPNIHREDYRHYSLYGTIGRGEACATVQEMGGFGHLVNLNSMTYDKGSKIVGMIEERLGEAAFFDFMRHIYAKYHFSILRVADFQHELEAYTGRSWDEFFKNWLYGAGLSDWCLEKVDLQQLPIAGLGNGDRTPKVKSPVPVSEAGNRQSAIAENYQATIFLKQKAEINEQTVLGICLDGSEAFQIRIPIIPGSQRLDIQDPPATVECLPDNRVRVDVTLPCKPTQIMVDPDQILVDKNPANNCWKTRVKVRVTPVYTLLDETDLTNSYDRWNLIFGPWFYGGAYNDPWFSRSEMFGLRAGVYSTQHFAGGGYLAYRTDDRNIVAGVDGLLDHWPFCTTQVGFIAERSLTRANDSGNYSYGVLYNRYIFSYGDSLYLPPMHYVEVFSSVQDDVLPKADIPTPGAERFDQQTTAGVHYHIDYLTPYWDPEGGFRFDATYQTGIPILGEKEPFNSLMSQVSYVKSMPDLHGPAFIQPLFDWFSETRLALRAFGGVALPDKGEFFTLGGGQRFRGYDLQQRQGSLVWVGSVEWRVPLAKGLAWDFCDHVAGVRSIYLAPFYDAGDAYIRGHQVGDVAHALGAGLRVNVAWFGLIERTTLRFDVAKTVNDSSPVQFWFGIQHPF